MAPIGEVACVELVELGRREIFRLTLLAPFPWRLARWSGGVVVVLDARGRVVVEASGEGAALLAELGARVVLKASGGLLANDSEVSA